MSFTTVSSSKVSNNVKWYCSQTPWPEACEEQLKSKSSYIPKTKSEFRDMSVKATVELALSANNHNKNLGPKCRNKKEKEAWADCLELYQQTIHQLNTTVDPNSKFSDDDAQTWLSSALTNLETCIDGFRELGVTDFVLPQMNNNVSKLICNALAINKIPKTSEEESTKVLTKLDLCKDGFVEIGLPHFKLPHVTLSINNDHKQRGGTWHPRSRNNILQHGWTPGPGRQAVACTTLISKI
ncbi:Pectinesterase [Thalictrum thalictroides]|uniref:Pectinesterase n=1 Tax=Thalictrum thalictroides TaxID=46969 RepID=A0A7J6X473_THATH|nr:Pectinesterase [Thalictrum thalictroides]